MTDTDTDPHVSDRRAARLALAAVEPPAWLRRVPSPVLYSRDLCYWLADEGLPAASLLDVEAERARRDRGVR